MSCFLKTIAIGMTDWYYLFHAFFAVSICHCKNLSIYIFPCLFQDKPQPPPEGRLPDATKGRSLIFTTIVMNAELIGYIHHVSFKALTSLLLTWWPTLIPCLLFFINQVLTTWGKSLASRWVWATRTLLPFLVATPWFVTAHSCFLQKCM